MEYQMKELHAEVAVSDLPDCIGDRRLMDQVFTNLIDNALKFSRTDIAPRIEIGSTSTSEKVIYFVKDNGVGISSEHASKVFEIFHRLNPKATLGDGLGLTMTQRMMEKQHGRIWIESTPGEGSCFFIELPAAKSHSE